MVGATENGAPTTGFGVWQFQAGMLSPPGTDTYGMRVSFFDASSMRDQKGSKAVPDFSLHVLTLVPFYLRMTEAKVFGADYGFAITQGFADMSIDLKMPTSDGVVSNHTKAFRATDLTLYPYWLQWSVSKNFFINTTTEFMVPTGDYDKKRLVNSGVNHWAASPQMGVTYISDTGFEVSSNFEVTFSSRNHATNYKNGVEYTHEFAVGQHYGQWTVGVGGYVYRQLTDDNAPGLSSGNRARATALGPAISYVGNECPAFWLHVYKEFYVRNRPEGYSVSLRLGKVF